MKVDLLLAWRPASAAGRTRSSVPTTCAAVGGRAARRRPHPWSSGAALGVPRRGARRPARGEQQGGGGYGDEDSGAIVRRMRHGSVPPRVGCRCASTLGQALGRPGKRLAHQVSASWDGCPRGGPGLPGTRAALARLTCADAVPRRARTPTEETTVSLPPLVEPADELTVDEVRRYSRHLIIPDVGMTGQKRLKNAKVLCVGAGGLGSPALLYLAAAGVGTLGIVDFDIVDESNLQRQIIHGQSDIGRSKAESRARQSIREINPLRRRSSLHEERLDSDNVHGDLRAATT